MSKESISRFHDAAVTTTTKHLSRQEIDDVFRARVAVEVAEKRAGYKRRRSKREKANKWVDMLIRQKDVHTKVPYKSLVAKLKRVGLTFSRPRAAKVFYKRYEADPSLIKVFDEFFENGMTINDEIDDEMLALMQQKPPQPFNNQIYGPYGTGKSRDGRCIGINYYCRLCHANPVFHFTPKHPGWVHPFVIYPEFGNRTWSYMKREWIYNGHWVNIFYAYSYDQAKDVKKLMKPGDICFMDEIEKMHLEGSQIAEDCFTAIIETSDRRLDHNMIECCINPIKISQVDNYYYKVVWDKTSFKACLVRQFMDGDGNLIADGIAVINVREPTTITRMYDFISGREKAALAARGGLTKAGTGDIDEMVKIVMTELDGSEEEDRDFAFSDEKDAMFYFIKENVDEAESWHDKVIRQVISHIWYKLSSKDKDDDDASETPDSERSLENQKEPTENFPWDDERVKNIAMQYKNPKNPDNKELSRIHAEMYLMRKEGFSQREVAEKFGYEFSTVSKVEKSVTSHVSSEMGRLYGIWLAKKFERDLSGLAKVIYDEDNTRGNPDIEIQYTDGRYVLYSVKCENPESTVEHKKGNAFNPEIQRARLLRAEDPARNITVMIHYHAQKLNITAEKEIDYMRPPDKVSIKGIGSKKKAMYIDFT